MSDIASLWQGGRSAVRRRSGWRLFWPLRRSLVAVRRRWHDDQLRRQSHNLLRRADPRLLYDLGLEPADLNGARQRGGAVRRTADLMRED